LIAAVQKGSDEKINDAKERITVMESQKKGGSDAWALVAAGIGGIIAFLSVMVAIITLVMKK
jgi:phage tail tape-measure protein